MAISIPISILNLSHNACQNVRFLLNKLEELTTPHLFIESFPELDESEEPLMEVDRLFALYVLVI